MRGAAGQNVDRPPTCHTIAAWVLQLPGEPRYRFVEIFLAVIAVLGLCALGCATPRARSRRYPASVFEAARYEARTQPTVPPATNQE